MIKGQKSVRGGIEDMLHPCTDMYITQGSNGGYSHKGIMANDIRGVQSGVRYPYYAPCTSKCMAVYPSSGQAMWQSVGNVRCPNEYVGKVTYMTCHDDSFDAKVGMVVPQGNQLGNMGTKGNATGVHLHFQTAQTSSTKWYKNSHGIYRFDNEVDIDDVCFVDNTNILNGMGGNWRKTSDVPVDEPKKEEPKKEESNPVDPEVTNKELTNRITELEFQVQNLNGVQDLLEKENETLKETIKLQDVEILELKKRVEEQPKLIFTCTQTNDYQIKLYENERLYIREQ